MITCVCGALSEALCGLRRIKKKVSVRVAAGGPLLGQNVNFLYACIIQPKLGACPTFTRAPLKTRRPAAGAAALRRACGTMAERLLPPRGPRSSARAAREDDSTGSSVPCMPMPVGGGTPWLGWRLCTSARSPPAPSAGPRPGGLLACSSATAVSAESACSGAKRAQAVAAASRESPFRSNAFTRVVHVTVVGASPAAQACSDEGRRERAAVRSATAGVSHSGVRAVSDHEAQHVGRAAGF